MAQKIVTYSGETLKPYSEAPTAQASPSGSSGDQKIVTNSGKVLKPYTYKSSFFNDAESLERDANQFIRMANRDNSEDRYFNAADYFEERKKQGEALKRRAADITQQIEADVSFDPESYQPLIDYLANFDTAVDDVLSMYQPSLDSREGMRAYEDEMIAAMERNEQLGKIDRIVDYAFEPGSPSANFMQQFRQYQNDNSYLNVTDDWTEEERYNLGLLRMENLAEAQKYAEQVNNYHNAQATEQRRQQIRDQAPGDIWGNTGRALLASMMGAGELIDRAAENAARGRTTEKNYLTATDYANETTGAINEYLNNRYGTVDTSGFQNLRDIGQQGLRDAGVDASYVDGAGNGLLNLARDMVDQKGVGDVYNFGYSLAQNLASRYTLGVVGGQPLVLANYFANAATSAIDDARRKGATGNQAYAIGMIKGALEVGTEFIPTKKLFEMGPAVTVKDFLKDLGIEALEEFVGEGANALGGYIADKKIMGDLSEFETAKRNYMEQGMTEEQAHALAIKDAVANIAFEGFSGALSGAISGGTESAAQTMRINQLYRNVDPQSLIDEGLKTEEGSSAFRRAMAMQEALNNQQKISANDKRILGQTTLQQLAAAKVEAEAQAAEEQQPSESAAPEAPAENRSAIQISTKNPIDILDFDSMDGKNATLQLKDGGTVDYDDVNFADQQQANQFYAVRSLPGLDTESANDLLHTIQDADAAKDIDSVVGIRDAYRIGYFNLAESDLAKSDSAVLSPQLRKAVFDIGRKVSQVQAAVQRSAKLVTAKPTGKYKKIVLENPGMKITTKRRAELDYVDKVADAFAGTTVHVFESYKKGDGYYFKDSSGKEHKAPNGKYVNGEIWLDINAGDKDGLILHTFAHEMYHHIEAWNKTKANELASFVAKELGIENVDKAVADQIEKARAAGYGEEYFTSQGKSDTEAENEVYARAMSDFVADSLETMFTRGNPAEAIARLHSEDKGLFDKLKKFIDKWISHVKAFYKDKTISQEGAVVAQLKNFEQLQQLFMEAMKGAGENYRAADISEEQAEQADRDLEAQYSLKGVNKDGVEVYETSDEVKNLTKKERQARFLDIMKNEYRGRTAKFIRNGHAYYATFDEKDINKNIYGDKRSDKKGYRAKVNAGADGDIFELVENSKYDGSKPEKGKKIAAHNRVGYWDYFIKTVQIDGVVYNMNANVRKKTDGEFVYSIQLNENKKIKASPPLGLLLKASNGVTNASGTTVTQTPPTVNTGMNSLRNPKPPTAREILMGVDISKRNKAEQYHLGAYQERMELLAEERPKLEALQNQIKELEADGKKHPELNDLRSQERKLRYSVDGLKREINKAERYDMFRRIVAEERRKLQEQQSRENLRAYKQEQRETVEAMQTEQRVLSAQLKNTDDFATVMGEELAKLANDYEAQKIDLKTKDEQIRRLQMQYNAAKARVERNKESQSVQKQRKHVEEKSKALMKMLTNPTKDAHVPMELQESLREFLNSIDFTSVRKSKGGAATVRDIAYTNALEDLRRAVAAQRSVFEKEDGTFKLDVPPEFMEKIDDHIKTIKAATKGLDLNTNRVYEMSGAELKDLSYLLGVINKAIREIDKFHLQGEKARTSGYAQETVQEMSTRKPVKGEDGNKYLWGNSTPWYAFRRYGKAGQRIFKGLTQGQAKLARNTDSIVKFAENTYTSKEVREWERERHTIKLDSGKTVTMSTAQIMSFWCLSHRDQAIPHMQGGGMRLTTLKKSMDGTSVQNEVVQKEHFTLTLEDVNRINNLLTGRQQEVARKLQQFMQTVGGRFINEISMARWDYMAATETDYFPIQTDDTGRDAKNPDWERTSLFALLNKSFTKAPMKNARNALVVDSIFNVFANHMSETAEYNAFALPLVDAMKWFNYKERIDIGDGHIKDVSVQKAIEDTLGKNARRYFIDLMTDINSSQKAGRHEDVFGKILGRSKVSSVAWNTRVAIQQLSALPRASMVLKPRYLLSGASKFGLQYAVKEMQKYSGIALWKSMGYYDLNVARSVEQQIKHDTSLLDQFNEMGMWMPGKMDERTWARIWIATREQIRNDRKLSGEELLQATADLFEDVVYQTQVADSVLTRSSFMRSKSQIIKEATSFMAEPTLSTNILMYAFEDYEAGHTTWEKANRGLTIGFTGYALSAVANALLGSLADAWRDDDEYETFWEKYLEALLGSKEKLLDGNLFSELNPLEKFIFVKDFLSVAKGFEPHSSYSKLISSGKDLLNAYQSAMEGKGSKTTYGIVYQTLQYLSTLSGTALGNMTREVEDLWNNTFGKEYPDLRLEKYKPDNGDELLQAIQKGTEEDIQRVFGRFENQQQAESALQSAIGEQYRSGNLSAEEAQQLLTDNFDREDEHEVYWLFDKWDYAKENGSAEGWTKYGKLLEGVESGDFQSEMNRLMEHGAEASDIKSQISRVYRKKYLENPDDREEIQNKLQPVYEATGMHDDEILQKFHDWDFEAEYGMTYGEMKGEFRDGNVTENELRQAMKFYGRKNYQIEEDIRNLNKEIKFYDKYEMSMSEMTDAYDRGDVSRNTMIGAKVFNGMTKKEAQEWVNQRDISNSIGIDFMELDDAYKYGDISRTTLRNAILKNGETPEKADEAMMGYDWLKKNVKRYPDLAISDAKKFAVRIHSDYAPDETLEDYGVSIDAYIEYQRLRPECKGVDANGDGKTDDGTLRDSVFRMIDSLPISSEAKDGLALMSYSAKSIRRNAPWH